MTLTIGAVLAGLVLIAFAAVSSGRSPVTAAPTATIAFGPVGLVTDGYELGRPDAAVTVEVYEDFQCPACRRWGENVLPALAAQELASGEAKLVFRDLAFLGPESTSAARAGFAAAQQGRFWDLWATIYANQGRENSGALAEARLIEFARSLGLDVDRFTGDMASPAAHAHVSEALDRATAAGVSSTPTIVVAGSAMVGATYPEIAAAIDRAAP